MKFKCPGSIFKYELSIIRRMPRPTMKRLLSRSKWNRVARSRSSEESTRSWEATRSIGILRLAAHTWTSDPFNSHCFGGRLQDSSRLDMTNIFLASIAKAFQGYCSNTADGV